MLVACTAIVALNIQVRQEIEAFATADSDSTQWSLAQVDVELLALQNALLKAQDTGDSSLHEVRRRFDVFYSRVNTLMTSATYAPLRENGSTAVDLDRIVLFLSSATRLIDGGDPDLRQSLPDLAAQVDKLRPAMRGVSLSGVEVFSGEANSQRLGVANVLRFVSAITLALFAILLLLLTLFVWINRQTREKTVEQSQLRSRLQAIVSTSLDAVVVADHAGRVLEFNEAAEELFGYSRAEAIGELMEDLIIPRHMVDAHRAGIDRYRRTGERRAIGKGRLQLEARRKSGEVFPVEFSISTAQSAEGEIFALFIRDLSRRVAAEKELIKARDEAVEGERAKANLLAVMSHEMRTPLNGMLGTLELLDREDVTEKQRQRLDIIRSSGLLLLQHVNKALDVSRADAGKIEPVAEVFSLGDLVSELVESQRAEAEHGGNSISHHVTTDGPDACRGDVALLSQILLNLIGNAIQFTRDGRITVTANRLQHDDLVDFRITDTGIGIADADQNRIFEDFMTLNKSDSGMAGGTGLGLGIARRLVAATGGEIGVESTPGNGSVFWFRAPLPAAPSVPQLRADPKGETAPREDPHSLPSLRVLVVEDNRVNRVVVSELLEQEGMQVDEAHDGAMGVRLAGANSYDLVLMDISLPVLDGVSATREIRAAENPETRVPIVALTAHALPEDIERFRAAGLNDILVKPISRSSVRAILEDVARDKIGSDGEQSDTSPESAPALVDRAHLSELVATLGEDRLAPLLEELGIEMERALNMLDSLSESDFPRPDLRIMVHHVAGSAAMLGARGLRSELVAIEEMLLLSDTAGGGYHIASLRAVWDRTQPLLQTCCQRKPA